MRAVGGMSKFAGAVTAAALMLAVATVVGYSPAAADPLPCVLQPGGVLYTCTITFEAQPADAQSGTTITSVPGNQLGAAVKVKVTNIDGPQSGVEVTLTPTPSAPI